MALVHVLALDKCLRQKMQFAILFTHFRFQFALCVRSIENERVECVRVRALSTGMRINVGFHVECVYFPRRALCEVKKSEIARCEKEFEWNIRKRLQFHRYALNTLPHTCSREQNRLPHLPSRIRARKLHRQQGRNCTIFVVFCATMQLPQPLGPTL